jgi:hypothetical protein
MTTASAQAIETLSQLPTPEAARATMSSGLAALLASLLAAHRERQAARVARILRQGLAAAD